MADDSLASKRILVCKDQRGQLSLLTQKGLEKRVQEGRGLKIKARMDGEGGNNCREVVYEGIHADIATIFSLSFL